MKYGTILLAAWLLTGCKATEGKKIQEECMPTINNFFLHLEKNDYVEALNNLLASNPNILPNDSSTVSMRKQFSEINQYSGAFRGKTLVNEKTIKDDVAAFSYLVKYEKKFYRFTFVFYNNGISTRIFKFSFDDSAEFELEESMKLYF
jgi:hypothetical protein